MYIITIVDEINEPPQLIGPFPTREDGIMHMNFLLDQYTGREKFLEVKTWMDDVPTMLLTRPMESENIYVEIWLIEPMAPGRDRENDSPD